MNRDEKILLSVLVVVAILGPLALGLALHWHTWQWVLLAIALLGVVYLLARRMRYIGEQRELRAALAEQTGVRDRPAPPAEQRSTLAVPPPPPYATAPVSAPVTASPTVPAAPPVGVPGVPPVAAPVVPPVSYAAAPLSGVSLPSALPDYRFVFSATVHWRPANGTVGPPHASLPAVANNAIIARACEITAAEHPGEHTMVQHKLNAALGIVLPDVNRRAEVWAVQVSLTLPATDMERLRKLAETRKDEEVWEHERTYERNKRAYLAEDVLKTPGSAVVWWLARNPDSIRETVGLIGILAQLSAAANDSEVPELFRPMAEQVAEPSVVHAGSVLADQLTRLLAGNGQDVAPLDGVPSQAGVDDRPDSRQNSSEPALWRPRSAEQSRR